MELLDVINARRSVKKFEPEHEISDDEFETLFGRVSLSPSSFNIQPWRFVVVRDRERKKALRGCAMNQAQVEEASATIIVVGKLDAYTDAEEITADMPADVRDRSVRMIRNFYEGNAALQRDEAIRSTSLAAMTLMLAAQDLGYATGPMIGFDPDAVSEEAGLGENEIPVMLIVIGKEQGKSRPRGHRFKISRIVNFDRRDGRPLE